MAALLVSKRNLLRFLIIYFIATLIDVLTSLAIHVYDENSRYPISVSTNLNIEFIAGTDKCIHSQSLLVLTPPHHTSGTSGNGADSGR